jgi:hypothetical protein
MTTSTADVFRNESAPDWGLGLVVEDQEDRWVLVFEHGGRRTFIKAKAKGLNPVTLDEAALAALQVKLQGRHAARGAAKAPKAKAGKAAAARFATFEEQLKAFERLYEGGFEGERYLKEERGEPGVMGKGGYKEAAIALAKEKLAPERFGQASPEELFEDARRLLAGNNILHPIEGAIPLGTVAEADRPALLAGLEQLLHGEQPFGERLEHFVAAVVLKDKNGKLRKVTWPLATVFAALYAPQEHTCVKPTSFATEGATLGMAVKASQPVTAEGYQQFLEVAKQTHSRLLDAGHRPRDLMDVYTFIWRTHAEKPAAAPGTPG